jgi:hypothetical protein
VEGDTADSKGRIDWKSWHLQYDDPTSSLSRRLVVVRGRVRQALARLPVDRPVGILSLCSGDGRDLLPELASLERRDWQALLVEKDGSLASAASGTARRLGLDEANVIAGDAGEWSTFAAFLPVDVLLLCGIFGNISDTDVRATVASTPAMLRAGATVIWTRGSSDPDLRPLIRSWFTGAGLIEVGFDSEPEGFGVGVARLATAPPAVKSAPDRLFSFNC